MYITKIDTYPRETYHIFSLCDEIGVSAIDEIASNLDNSQEKQVIKLGAVFERAAMFGPGSMPPEKCHHIDDGIWQFRADDIRILWFYDKGHIIICTNGFIKKGKKTPKKQITKAKQLRADYFRSKADNKIKEVEE